MDGFGYAFELQLLSAIGMGVKYKNVQALQFLYWILTPRSSYSKFTNSAHIKKEIMVQLPEVCFIASGYEGGERGKW